MATRTSSQAGLWASTSTWGGSAAPTSVDTANVNHVVEATADAEVATLNVAGSGALTVTGCKLTVTVGGTVGEYTGGTAVDRLILRPSGSTPAGLEFDGASGVTPTLTFPSDSRLSVLGTSSGRCFVRTKAGTVGNPGRIAGDGGSRSGQVDAAYCDFARLGGASADALNAYIDGASAVFRLANCTFTTCGQVYIGLENPGTLDLSATTFTSSAGTPLRTSSGTAISAGTRSISGCSFDAQPLFYPGRGITIGPNNYFPVGFGSLDYEWASLAGNLVRKTVGGSEFGVYGSTSGNFWLIDGEVTNPHFCQLADSRPITMDGDIFEFTGTLGNGDCVLIPSPSSTTTYTVKNCIKLPNASGLSSGTLVSALGNTNARIVMDHNTIHGGGGTDSSGNRIGETQASFAGQVTSCRSNLYWDTTARGFLLCDISASPATDAVLAANCDYNALYNASGTGYSTLPTTGTKGVHDITGDPGFLDSTRDLASWDGSGSVAAALAKIAANPALIADMIAWVKAGFALTAAALNPATNGSHDGAVTRGAVAWQAAVVLRVSRSYPRGVGRGIERGVA